MHLPVWSAGLPLCIAGILGLLRLAGPRGDRSPGGGFPGVRLYAELASATYIGVIAAVADVTGAGFILFPELGALSHEVFGHPHGRWARSPLLLVLTPVLTATIGTLVTRTLAYGLPSILLSVGCALLVIRALKSPVAPAISAGLLPLVLGVASWWYPPAVAFGAGLLAGISVLRAGLFALPGPASASVSGAGSRKPPQGSDPRGSDHRGSAPLVSDYLWMPWFLLFLVAAYAAVVITGWRFLLYPPLVVIGFEMLSRTEHCPWARRPLLLPVVCFLTAAAGMASFALLGGNPIAAMVSMALGLAILRIADMHVPPALAVALLPLVIDRPTPWYPVAVGLGTAILTACFLLYQATLRLAGAALLPVAGRVRRGSD